MDLSGKVALVTGGARRVGRAISLAFAHAGASVIIHHGHSPEEAEATAGEVRQIGGESQVVRADLSRPEEIEAMFAAVADAPGLLDVLVNNAAVFDPTPLAELTAEAWDAQFAVNARAPALCIRHALPLLSDGGAVINVVDISSEQPWPGYPAYCASKAALLNLTRSAARALADRGIRVNAVSPGVAEWAPGTTERQKRTVLDQVPLGRPGSPTDIASAAVFLAGHDYMTGQNLRVDGGWCVQ